MTQDEATPPDRAPRPGAGPPGSNLPELSVGDLSRALKRTVEDAFSYVRVRGEISQPKFHGSGHCYLRLKDETAVIEAVCWKGTVARLSVRPAEGLEVVCTGKLTTYPGRSQYQLVIDSMQLAGEGALLKMLEERKRRLAAEGLFAPERKRRLPFLPEVIGVVTSPTGAVIRDILHRLDDRFPRRVLVWPVAVQGEGAAAQVAAAIEGFNRLSPGGRVPRPDVLIVARGGGSLEDLMAFNEEAVVRAAAASAIPLISAVGHETDTTLIDHAADRRAPTPTAAAEMAVPVRAELLAQAMDCGRRLYASASRGIEERRTRVQGLARGLGDPRALLDGCVQRLDDRAERLDIAVRTGIDRRRTRLAELGARIRHPREILGEGRNRLDAETRALGMALRQVLAAERARLTGCAGRLSLAPTRQRMQDGARRAADMAERLRRAHLQGIGFAAQRLDRASSLLESYSFRRVLDRGFALVTDDEGRPVTAVGETRPGQSVTIEFRDGKAVAAIGGPGVDIPPAPPAPRRPRERVAERPAERAGPRAGPPNQGTLF
jgi:exodeoxyribonuclease VII large subunit